MRVFITLLVAVAALFATSEAAVGSTTKLTNIATSESIADLQTQSNGKRYLRERDTDELDSEDRTLDFKKIGSTVKGLFASKDEKLVNLLKSGASTDKLLTKKINPETLERAVYNLQNKFNPEDYKKLKSMAKAYGNEWYRTNKLDPL